MVPNKGNQFNIDSINSYDNSVEISTDNENVFLFTVSKEYIRKTYCN